MDKNKVVKFIDDNSENVIRFLKEFVSTPSVNPGPETDCPKEEDVQKFISETLEKYGVEIDVFAADSEGNRPNIVAVLKGTGGGKDIILNGHVDTVIVSKPDNWDTDPFKAVQKDGKIYGRGACDMKGGLASAIWALKAIKDCKVKLKGDVILQLVVGEESCEGGTIGTAACIERGYKAPFAVVCEPTSLEIHNTTASLLCFELIIPGKSAHICCRNQAIFPQSRSLPSGSQVGVDAVEKALPFIEYFYKLEKMWNHRWKDSGVGTGGKPRHDKQGIGAFNINPSFIESGSYIAAVPESVKITYALWHPSEIPAEEIIDEIKDRVKLLASTDDWLRENPPIVNAPIAQLWPGFVTPEENEGVAAFKKSFEDYMKREPIVSGFRAVCDGTYLDQAGIKSIVFGPGDISDGVHGDNECVPIQEVIDAAKIYAGFMIDWCS